jgi:ABC-type branched-subunit amino acid transport system ATPase component
MSTSLADGSGRPSSLLLSVRGLFAGYGGVPMLRDVSVDVMPSSIAAVIGPNGSGKSTLLKGIVGIIPVQSGEVRLEGRDVTNAKTEDLVSRGVGYVPQLSDVFAPLTVHENLAAGGYLLPKREVAGRAEFVFTLFPALSRLRSRTAGRLSGGERKMTAIGRALMLQPKLLFLDEPTANLAPALARAFLEEAVPRLAESGTGVLLVEQRARSALQVADWGYVLVSGECKASAPSVELLNRADIGEMFLGGSGDSALRQGNENGAATG